MRFITGGTYDYFGVPVGVYQEFLSAPSKGQFVNWRVKPRYPDRRVK